MMIEICEYANIKFNNKVRNFYCLSHNSPQTMPTLIYVMKKFTHIDPPKNWHQSDSKTTTCYSFTYFFHIQMAHQHCPFQGQGPHLCKYHHYWLNLCKSFVSRNLYPWFHNFKGNPNKKVKLWRLAPKRTISTPNNFFKNYLHNILMKFYICVRVMHKF